MSRRRMIMAVALLALVLSGIGWMAHLNGDSLDFSNTDVKIVVSGSMDGEPRDEYDIRTIPTGSMIFIHKVTDESFYPSLKVGDVLTFNYTHPVDKKNMVVTHRIISISESRGVYTYTLAGDSIRDDPTNGSVQVVASDSGDIIGKVVGVSHFLGDLVRFMSDWTGKVVLILIPCLILIASEAANIARILRGRGEPEPAVEAGPAEPVSAPPEGVPEDGGSADGAEDGSGGNE